jgi:drug/metabolite transporter (DMT)-like permease
VLTAEGRGTLLLVAAALLWSTGGIGIKALPDPPLRIACLRSAIAALVLLAVVRPRGWRWSAALGVAIAAQAGLITLFVVATKWTTAANAIFLQSTGVVWVLLAAPLVLGEPRTRRDVIAVGLAFAGVSLFFAGELDPRARAGDVLGLLSGVFYAVLVLSLRRERDRGAEAVLIGGNALAAAALLPVVAPELTLTLRSAVILALLGTVQLAGAYVLFVRGIRHVPAARAALISMLEPVANPIWVFLLVGERPRPSALAGGLVVLGAIAWRTFAGGTVSDTPASRS